MSLILNFLKSMSGNRTGSSAAATSASSGEPGLSAAEQMRVAETLSMQLRFINKDIRRNSGYMARQEIQALHESLRPHPKRLEQYGFKIYSQNDEDGILAEIFKRIGISRGIFCEIGVENGLQCNSLFLIHQGWRGAWLEANGEQKSPIETKFQSLLANNRLALEISYITPQNINDILVRAMHKLNVSVDDLDFLSIDIDGMDIHVLGALEHNPKVIVIEYNARFPPPLSKKPVFNPYYAWEHADYMGSSLTAINEVANAKGYSLVGTNLTGVNAFFVRNDLLGSHFEEKLDPEWLYNPPRYYLTADHFQSEVGHDPDFGPYVDLE